MKKIFFIFAILFFVLTPEFILATTGTIDSQANFAWSSNLGWINFAPQDNNKNYVGLQIFDNKITGQAWSQTLGWINFEPQNGGIFVDPNGILTGNAFGSNVGWVDFSGVTIGCDGKFVGQARGATIGVLNFDCQNCNVKTHWRAPICNEKNHNQCNKNRQCVIALGAGKNQCQINEDCLGLLPDELEEVENKNNSNNQDNLIEIISNSISNILGAMRSFINTPLASFVTKTISTVGLVGTALVGTVLALSANVSLIDVLMFPLRILGVVMTAMGLKKRSLPWGVVYDSVTKQPLDPAYVILRDLQGKDVSQAITDLDGRYGFLVTPGNYQIIANKTNYSFPSQKLAGKLQDETYNNLYFGEPLNILRAGEVITKNIPLDPVKFDWNEFAKRNKSFMKFYSRWDALLRRLSDFFFGVGFVISIIAFIFAPYPYNTIIFVLYLAVLFLRILGLKPKGFGYIVDQITGDPLSFALVKIMMPTTHTEIAHRVADQYGRYYCLIPKGKYYVKIEKKNPDASYTLVYTSPIIDASKTGIIKKKFLV